MARPQKRWMKSVIETSKSDMPAMPWARNRKAAKPTQTAGRTPKGSNRQVS